jgi:hypothetical protein
MSDSLANSPQPRRRQPQPVAVAQLVPIAFAVAQLIPIAEARCMGRPLRGRRPLGMGSQRGVRQAQLVCAH